MIEEAIGTALKPLTTFETWYGVWFAIAVRKSLMGLIQRGSNHLGQKYFGANNEDVDNNNEEE